MGHVDRAVRPDRGARDDGRQASRQQIERVIVTELAALDPRERAGRVAAVDALVSGERCDLLRTVHGLGPDEATVATAAAVTTVLTVGAPGSDGAAARRRAEAQVLLDAAEVRIARLVDAVEAGAPADVVGPSLAALQTERDEAAAELGRRAGGPPA